MTSGERYILYNYERRAFEQRKEESGLVKNYCRFEGLDIRAMHGYRRDDWLKSHSKPDFSDFVSQLLK